MFPPQHPCSPTGQLESELRSVRSDLHNKANSYELDAINRRLDSLENSMRELRSEITGIWDKLSEVSTERY